MCTCTPLQGRGSEEFGREAMLTYSLFHPIRETRHLSSPSKSEVDYNPAPFADLANQLYKIYFPIQEIFSRNNDDLHDAAAIRLYASSTLQCISITYECK